MELKQLRRFLVVAETKNFHSAAEILNITQPALSQSIHKLEDSVGTLLFLRGARGVELTEVGKLLIPRAKLILKFVEDFTHEVGELKDRRSAHLKVGVANYFARDLFPEAFVRFATQMPTVLLDISEDYTPELLRAIEHGDLDMAFCGLREGVTPHPAVTFEHLYTGRFSFFARTGHPIFLHDADVLARMAEFPWAIHDRNTSGEYFAQVFDSEGLAAPNFSVQSHSLQVITSIVCASDHVALIADDFARPELESGRIKKIDQTAVDIKTEGGVFTLRDAPRSPALSTMIEALRQVCKERENL